VVSTALADLPRETIELPENEVWENEHTRHSCGCSGYNFIWWDYQHARLRPPWSYLVLIDPTEPYGTGRLISLRRRLICWRRRCPGLPLIRSNRGKWWNEVVVRSGGCGLKTAARSRRIQSPWNRSRGGISASPHRETRCFGDCASGRRR